MNSLTGFMRGHEVRDENGHNALRSGWRQAQKTSLGQINQAMVEFTDETAIPLLRVSLGIVYIWFGVLKIIGASPVAGMVAETAFLVPPGVFVRLVGLLELVVGLGLLFRAALHLTLVLFFCQLVGTFLVLFVRPQRLFQHNNPLLLTKEGEFLLKNLVLLSAGLAVASTAPREDERIQ
jgi:uncharacterized membrane protein YkgB